jgi:hypothetical protein
MKKDNINRIGDLTEENYLFPKHLKPCVIHGALFIHNGKDTDDKIKRTELILKKLGTELSTYVMALLTLPQLMETVIKSDDYTTWSKNYKSQSVH